MKTYRLPVAPTPARLPSVADWAFLYGGRLLLALFLVIAVIGPLSAIFQRGLADQGQYSGLAAAWAMVSSDNFQWLLGNSLKTASTVALIVTPLAYLFAYALQKTLIPGKSLWRGISLIPLLAPSMLPGIALVYLFGNQGLLRFLLSDNIYGFWGIVLGEVIYTFPHALMILLSALALSDARLYDAASSMGASSWKKFLSVTWPSSRQGVFAAFCLVFTLVVTDFSIPVVVGGNYQVLALEAYKSVIGQQQFNRGALIGLVLLVPALLTFAVDAWLRRRQKSALSSRAEIRPPERCLPRDMAFTALVALMAAVILLIFGTAVYSSFIKFWPYNLSFSLHHYDFADLPGGWLAYRNSVLLATLTAIIGTTVVFIGAYLVEKQKTWPTLNASLRALGFIPMAIPGLVLGLGYVFFFNLPSNPLNVLYGSMALLVICTVVHFFTTAYMTAATALGHLDGELEAASLSLKMPMYRHFFNVTLPICLPTVLDVVRYLFVSAMTTVSAAIFLYSPDTVLASVAVLNMDDAGNVGGAAAMATLILFTSAGVSGLIALFGRFALNRTQSWRTAVRA